MEVITNAFMLWHIEKTLIVNVILIKREILILLTSNLVYMALQIVETRPKVQSKTLCIILNGVISMVACYICFGNKK
jgi:hypothetical protein